MPLPATIVSRLLVELTNRFRDPLTPMDQAELQAMLKQLRLAQRNALAEELAPLFDFIGLVCQRLRAFPEALDAHRNAARYDKTCAAYLNNIAVCEVELGQYRRALETLRKAKACLQNQKRNADLDLCILLNEAETHHRLGDVETARAAFEQGLRLIVPERATDLLNAADIAAILGAEDDAVELFARTLAVANGADLGEQPAVDFIRTFPNYLDLARARSSALADAVARVVARDDGMPPAEHQVITQISLPDAGITTLLDMAESGPVPTAALRRLFNESRP